MVYRRLKKTRKIQSAHAILIVSERYAMQLRDNKPNISSPGIWSLFGGLIRKGEKPMHAIEREIDEELCIKPERFQPFRFIDYYSKFENEVIRTWFFISDVTRIWPEHKLTEGQKAEVFTFEGLSNLSMPPKMRQVLKQYHQIKSNINRSKEREKVIKK